MSSGFEIITVSQLNFYVRNQLDSDPMLKRIFLKGEISNFIDHYRSGHLYMSLKDENAVIKAVMFKNSARRLPFIPENGMKIIAAGRVSLYERDGQYQFYIDDMQPDGVGALHVAFEQLKAKLRNEGIFDEAKKRSIPPYPERIGIVTSETGAALQDILNILKRRWPVATVILYPVMVQGDLAPKQICEAINYFGSSKAVDVLIVGRGGGSIEELWAFNDENVARSIAMCPIPVVSAVGHETDFTIADFAADLRAPTPSAAAEIVSPNLEEVILKIRYLSSQLALGINQKLNECELRLDAAMSSQVFKEPANVIKAYSAKFDALNRELDFQIAKLLKGKRDAFISKITVFEALNPLKVLMRGYTIASDENGLIASVADLNPGKKFNLAFKDGTAECCVDGKILSSGRSGMDEK